jgi:hypothetical protein
MLSGGCNRLPGSFFVSFLEKQKRKHNRQSATIKKSFLIVNTSCFTLLFFLIKKEAKKSRINEWLRPFIRPTPRDHPTIYG